MESTVRTRAMVKRKRTTWFSSALSSTCSNHSALFWRRRRSQPTQPPPRPCLLPILSQVWSHIFVQALCPGGRSRHLARVDRSVRLNDRLLIRRGKRAKEWQDIAWGLRASCGRDRHVCRIARGRDGGNRCCRVLCARHLEPQCTGARWAGQHRAGEERGRVV
jgi:hypothetical protein